MLRLALPRAATLTRALRPHYAPFSRTHISNFSTTMAKFQPNTEPPKGFAIFKNLEGVAADSDKFRRVLWTGTHSQVRARTLADEKRVFDVGCWFDVARNHDRPC